MGEFRDRFAVRVPPPPRCTAPQGGDAGRRGVWKSISVAEQSSLCESAECDRTFRITTDEMWSKTEAGEVVRLVTMNSACFQLVSGLAQGVGLRPWLEAGGDCEQVPDESVRLELELELDDETLSAKIAGCPGEDVDPADASPNFGVQAYQLIAGTQRP